MRPPDWPGQAARFLVMMVWQGHDRNEWEAAIRQSLSGPEGWPAAASGGPDPFSLADPPAVTETLEAAGFSDVTFTDVREPMYFGPDVSAALDWVHGFASTTDVLGRLDPAAAARARAARGSHRRSSGSPRPASAGGPRRPRTTGLRDRQPVTMGLNDERRSLPFQRAVR